MKNIRKKPIIGITLDSAKDSEKYKYATFPWYAVRKNYADCVVQAGGIPIMLTHDISAIDEIIDLIDGLIIPGGDEDIHPKFYNQRITFDKIKTNDERATLEIELTKKALEKDIPFLGICNGMQVLNVVCGGTLIQHIPDYLKTPINHQQPILKDSPSHLINIKPSTKLSDLANGNLSYMVNSTHHQAVEQVGAGLIISAIAPDGIIEAIESASHRYAIGVEWHPEYLNSELDLNLFKNLVNLAYTRK